MQAPRRKLKAERAWSSTYIQNLFQPPMDADERRSETLVVTAFHEPAAGIEFLIETIETSRGGFDIPFIAVPRVIAPPVAGGSPRAFGGYDRAVHGGRCDARRPLLNENYLRILRRAEAA